MAGGGGKGGGVEAKSLARRGKGGGGGNFGKLAESSRSRAVPVKCTHTEIAGR